ncbi:initiator tRNA phosphoribosyl transferase-domain-containing protein [Boeremia exigua]|uniref:initiator tRNA phosphoribosyl transferase-domain-containing protein n=1 Tax=Boeremia exigua TaxID=749465 RepID=UPI001E8EAAA9|nr:initiator tRNA phosphoribosyl transferase-domain-containing protein [Boeremia exigua]KAH6622428.1 initiator tRNA phosphoribosyl transferase-domain-containing protein [Boeremia exigua]
MAQRLTESDIIFPHLSNTPNFSSTLSSLKRSALSITNRLNSITADSEFVTSVATSYGLPLVANERCGSWYIPLDLKAASVYFKSTDGHMGEWAFSLRRLNLQLLDVVSKHGGCVIVDSTRRGKSMPDALSKTVPFWCCVINRAVFGVERKGDDALALCTPPAAVSESENVQMERRIDGFVQQFMDICKPDIPSLRSKLQKPLRPLWVTQTSILPHDPPEFPDFHPVVLCTASRRVRGGEASEGGYIQGAADDHEAWSHGLTPPLFWRNKASLLHTNEENLPAAIASLTTQDQPTAAAPTLIKPTTTLYVSASHAIDLTPFDTVISCTPAPLPHASLTAARVKAYLHLPCPAGKLGSRALRPQLPALQRLASPTAAPKTLICCPTGTDLAVGTALAYLCLFADDAGAVDVRTVRPHAITKTLVRQRLSWITAGAPALNPSRATLQSVNAALMSSLAPAPAALHMPLRSRSPAHTETAAEPSTPIPPPITPRPSLPRTLFANLPSKWSFSRTLTSTHASQPSGTACGTAVFSTTGVSDTLDYAEEGVLTTEKGVAMGVRRGYIWRLSSPTNGEPGKNAERVCISIHFPPSPSSSSPSSSSSSASPSNDPSIGALFLQMSTLTRSQRDGEAVFEAHNRAPHLCGRDTYTARWRFGGALLRDERAGAGADEWWEVEYEARGPGKGYVSLTRYERVE